MAITAPSFRENLMDILKTHDFRTVELEFRLGFQAPGEFITNINKHVWTSAKEKLGTPVQEIVTIDKYTKSTSGESSRYVVLQNGQGYWEHKKKIAKETVPGGKYGVRSAFSLERKELGKPPVSFRMQRTKYRTTFVKGPWKIDFTRVESIPATDRDCESTYEIEVELHDMFYLFEKELDIILQEGNKLAQSIVM
ncbi:mRNA capping enzyme beta chain, RNA triphosphatase [Only Syngen Nebraska virus 5]|uniref:mRNA capping enzyme beta chain, RNA triphosphatase n=1 Tax=Only Syngen Nebraska virus 5 TaxID=1917232 RepID=UPI0009015527|nr:mRNA capping enzyme beta chain, RNA triphosphatase [Only Syngen Nebraska virus 5]APC25746.1 mRNA capping enzyme beta chain, RNA triphosphatase [Only Syngen Nebraska virus 5]